MRSYRETPRRAPWSRGWQPCEPNPHLLSWSFLAGAAGKYLFTSLGLGNRRPYQPQSKTVRCVFVQTIQPCHLNGNIRHEALKAADATSLPLPFQCIKLPPVMTSYAIIAVTTTFLSYAQLAYCIALGIQLRSIYNIQKVRASMHTALPQDDESLEDNLTIGPVCRG